jgi:hypothetical protein
MDINKADPLTLSYAQRVWIPLQDEHFKKDLERSLAKLCYVRGLPREWFEDFNHTVYSWCASRAGEFDPERASLKTWMILQARRIVISMVRDGGWASRTFGWEDVPECDLRRTKDGDPVTLDMMVTTSVTPESLLVSKEREKENEIARRVINRQVMAYAEMLDEKEKTCLDLLLSTNFEISDRQLALALDMSRQRLKEFRRRIYGELGLRLLQFGVSLNEVKDV